jgi:hypothetical protein
MATPTYFEVTIDAHDRLVAALDEVSRARKGWVNVQPLGDNDLPAERSGMFGILGPRIPDLALGTFNPPDARHPDGPAQVGVQHPVPKRALPVLEHAGLQRPEGWRRVQDAIRRGLVMQVPNDADLTEVAGWMLRATSLLTLRQTAGRWTVSHHPGR